MYHFPERTGSGTAEDDCIGGVRFPAPLLHFVYLDNRILKTDSKKHNYVTVKLGSQSAGWFHFRKEVARMSTYEILHIVIDVAMLIVVIMGIKNNHPANQ